MEQKRKAELSLWWRETGWKELNNQLINWVGFNTGYVPLYNFIAETCELTEEELEELIPFMVDDGAKVSLKKENDNRCVYIWVK